jgi:hypothetical protein
VLGAILVMAPVLRLLQRMTRCPPSLNKAKQMARNQGHVFMVVVVLTLTVSLLMRVETARVGAESQADVERQQAVKLRSVEGRVAKVEAGTLEIAWGPFGVFSKTLDVGSTTRIRVIGRPATIEDIRKGATIRAGYQRASGRNIAKTVDMVLAPIVSARAAP